MTPNRRPPASAETQDVPDADLPAPPLHEDAEAAAEGASADADDAATAAEATVAPPVESAGDYKERWLRVSADLQNFRRRALRDTEEARRIAEERVMLEMISAIDDLERALDSAREAKAPESWTGGVRLVVNRLVDSLARQGVVALHPLGEPFDPAFHEAILEIDAPQVEPGHIVEVVLRGYRRGDRALRPARVVVARRPSEH